MNLPKIFESIFLFYPATQAIWIVSELALVIKTGSLLAWIRLTLACFFLSPFLWLIFRKTFKRNTEGAFKIGKHASGGNLWLIYYQLQLIYTHFSFFERTLKLFPGFYSAWLRLWGSKIGVKVNWTAECQIVDRGHLSIGDRVFFGNRCYLSAHALKKIKNRYLLYVKKIEIGDDTMISYSCHIGPGVIIGTRVHVEAGARLYPNMKIADGETYADLNRTSHS